MTTSPTASALDLPPRYRRISTLGVGGGGEVWSIRDLVTGQQLALKRLSGHAGGPEAAALVREVAALCGLEGLGLPRVVRFGRHRASDRPFMIREMVDGIGLEQLLVVDPRRALIALTQCADQLTIVHRAGLLHGDIKPANVVVRPVAGATLVDFGLATRWSDPGTRAEGMTPKFAAPELLAGGLIGVRSEIYSLGVILRTILENCGTQALSASERVALDRVAGRATAFEPTDRYPSAAEFAADLRLALEASVPLVSTNAMVWPIVGLEAIAARLSMMALGISERSRLLLQGPEGSGRSVLLTRLAWSLGIMGHRLAWVDDQAAANLDVASAEIETIADAPGGFCLVDDMDRLTPELISRVERAQAQGCRLIAVTSRAAHADDQRFIVPPLTDAVSSELVKRAVPSLLGDVLAKVVELGGGRPGTLRFLVAKIAQGAVASVRDIEELLGALPASRPPRRVDCVERAGWLLDHGRYREAAMALGSADQQRLELIDAVVARARVALGLGEAREALSLLESVDESSLPHAPPQVQGAFWVCLARSRLGVADYQGVIDAGARVPEGIDLAVLEARVQVGLARSHLGDTAAADEIIQGVLEAAQEGHLEQIEALALSAKGLVAQRDDQLDGALRHYREAIRVGRSVGDAGLLAVTQLNLAGILKMRGDLAGAIENYQAALDLGERAGRRATVRNALMNLANFDLYLGRLSRARERIDQLKKEAMALPPKHKAQLLGLEAELFARTGDPGRAEEHYRACASAYHALGCGRDGAEATLEGVLLSLRRSDGDLADLRLQLEAARSSLGDSTAHRPLLLVVEGLLFLSAGDESSARKSLDEAVALARASHQKEWLWRALEARNDLEMRVGRRMNARRDREDALATLEEIALALPPDLREVFWNDSRRRALRDSVAGNQGLGEPSLPNSPNAIAMGRARADVSTLVSTPLEAHLARLLEINAELVGEVDLDHLSNYITEHAMRLVRAERALVLLRANDGALQVAWSRGANPEEPHVTFSTSVAEEVMASGEPIVSLSARDDARMAGWGSVHELMLQSVACVPIRAAGRRVIGALYLETRRRPGPEFMSELPMLQAFAGQVAIAIYNASLIRENRDRAEQLTVANQSLKEAHKRLEELLDAKRAELGRARQELRQTRGSLRSRFGCHGLVGLSEAMRRLYAFIDRVKDTEIPLLITGESGTGKEMVARAVHAGSPRSRRRFIGVNCGAIPENLLESELFGCVRGAFTGADRDRKGIFRESEGGTVLLDEIGEMSQKMQAGLLRVLQERRVRPVGGVDEQPVDVRLMFATHRDLQALVSEGRFREDLYYRIHVVEVHIPPLRERLDDIPQLVDHFLGIFAARYRRERRTISRSALRLLMAQSWRGNVRELENVLLNAWILADGDELQVGDFDLDASVAGLRSDEHPSRPVSPSATKLRPSSPMPRRSGDESQAGEPEKVRILEALRVCGQNRVRAAQMLGIPRRTFYRRLREYNIS